MALIKCKECNRDISDLESACPYCGCTVTNPIPERKAKNKKVKKKHKKSFMKKPSSLSTAAGVLIFLALVLICLLILIPDIGAPLFFIVAFCAFVFIAVVFALMDVLFHLKGNTHLGSWLTLLLTAIGVVLLFLYQEEMPYILNQLFPTIF